jgi:uncharacterized protein YqeY
MKASDKTSVSTLRLVKSSLKYRQIEKGGNLTDDDVIAVLSSMVKQRRESIEQYTKAGRDDLASSEMAEIEIIKKYLPEQISNEELEAIIRETIKELNASGAKDIGKVMKAVIPKVKGRADGKVINARVTQILSS